MKKLILFLSTLFIFACGGSSSDYPIVYNYKQTNYSKSKVYLVAGASTYKEIFPKWLTVTDVNIQGFVKDLFPVGPDFSKLSVLDESKMDIVLEGKKYNVGYTLKGNNYTFFSPFDAAKSEPINFEKQNSDKNLALIYTALGAYDVSKKQEIPLSFETRTTDSEYNDMLAFAKKNKLELNDTILVQTTTFMYEKE